MYSYVKNFKIVSLGRLILLLAFMDPVAVRPDGPLVLDGEIQGKICFDYFLRVQKRTEMPVPVVRHGLTRAF